MGKDVTELLSFNRGIISPLLMARVDVPRVALSAETQNNMVPRAMGAMSLRPGLEYKGATASNAASKHIPFIYSNSDTALIEITGGTIRFRVSDTLVTRPAGVTSAITNGEFTSNVNSWTDADETGATSSWLTGGYLSLLGTGTSAAIRYQLVTLAGSGIVHGLRVVVQRGPVSVRIGTSIGGEEYFEETELHTGTHSLAFTPSQNFYVQLQSRSEYPALVESVAIEAAGVMTLPNAFIAAELDYIRYAQSGDVVYIAAHDVQLGPIQIVRYGTDSWGTMFIPANKGPFRSPNTTDNTITASALTGLITLTAAKPLFKSTHEGALFRLTSYGQAVSQSAGAQNTFTGEVKITAAGTGRALGLTISGTWAGTVTLQRSFGVSGNWVDVTTYTTNASTTLDDSLDNQIVYYRLGIKTGAYTSGTATLQLVHAGGSITGIARVSAYTSSTVVTAYVLQDMGATTATDDWAEGAWSDYRGWPSAVRLREGRLWFVGKDRFWGSVVDDFANFDQDYPGDAGPVSRSIGEGPVDSIRWLSSAAGNLIAGGEGAEFLARSSTQEEPITPTNFNVRPTTSMGSANVDAVTLDDGILFVDRSGARLYEYTLDGGKYVANDLTSITPEVTEATIVNVAVQRRPDTRVHCVLNDGTVAMLIYSKIEEVRAWVTIETDGDIEEVIVLPGSVEDTVYYVVARSINGSTVRYLEKWALMDECVGATVNKQADAFYYYSGASTATISGLTHLEGESVVCWANGLDQGTFTVSSGAITLSSAVTSAVVGLTYTGRFKSTKLANSGVSLIARKRITHIGVLLTDTHAQGLTYGPDFDTLYDMPQIEAGTTVTQTGIWANYNYDHIPFKGSYTVDSRLCLQATAPRPCTVLACIIEMDK